MEKKILTKSGDQGKRVRQQEDQRKVLLDGMGRSMFVGPRSPQEKKKTNGIGIWHKDTLRLRDLYLGNSFILMFLYLN